MITKDNFKAEHIGQLGFYMVIKCAVARLGNVVDATIADAESQIVDAKKN